jgi:hypothetical protein
VIVAPGVRPAQGWLEDEAGADAASARNVEEVMVDLDIVAIDKPDDMNVIVGQAHFIKTVDDIHEALVGTCAGSSAPPRTRWNWSSLEPTSVEALSA